VTHSNLWKSLTVPETRVFRAADGENLVIVACTVFDWSTRVTDGRTDRWTESRWLRRAIFAVTRKNYNHWKQVISKWVEKTTRSPAVTMAAARSCLHLKASKYEQSFLLTYISCDNNVNFQQFSAMLAVQILGIRSPILAEQVSTGDRQWYQWIGCWSVPIECK